MYKIAYTGLRYLMHGIHLIPTCMINYVNTDHNYTYMRLIYVNMQNESHVNIIISNIDIIMLYVNILWLHADVQNVAMNIFTLN